MSFNIGIGAPTLEHGNQANDRETSSNLSLAKKTPDKIIEIENRQNISKRNKLKNCNRLFFDQD
ncbi:MAG: hypothetical protein U9N47_00920 [Thermodesulfobacteriota bacterium]|nr:hypothetical protein [Thermodesulfobacteriota bacterium]